jgi:ferredoxin-type protein NapG
VSDKPPEKKPADPGKEKKKPPKSRRGFFSELFSSLAVPLVDFADDKLKLGLKDMRDFVRPPGSIPESRFIETCRHSGYCVEACPVKAIVPLSDAAKGKKLVGTPVVVADTQPCVMCYDLACMAVCPTGAIIPLGREEIRMGTARWNEKACVRTAGEDCRLCVDKCPLHERVIRLNKQGQVFINEDTCTGCGECAYYCPTEPKSITIDPL